jgi:hypothetical protein
MKFLVEFRLSPNSESRVTETFSSWRPRRDPAVMFHGARIGARYDVIFVVSESEDEQLIARACQSWDEHGNYKIYPVSDAG